MTPPAANAARDPRLDFFRGSAMFIIFIAHCRGNFLWDYIPTRFGPSDAADMFVFLSGMAASIAFGGSFVRHGFVIGTARIVYRCWQLFVAHVGLLMTGLVVVALATRWFGQDYITANDLQRFFAHPADALIGIFTLTYEPHYFDILPLYIAVLAMVPAVMLLARINPLLVPVVSVALYLATNWFGWNFPANADEQPVWYFDPLAWQLIFFTGFSLRRGWIKVPLDSRWLFWGSVAILVLGVSVSLPSVFEHLPPIDALRIWIMAHSDKTYLDVIQYVHFLASVYVVVVLLKGHEQALLAPVLRPFVKCGQQALSVFVTGMILSFIGGMAFDQLGDGAVMQIIVNGLCFAVMFAVAYGVAWFKATPWKRPAPRVVPVSAVVVPATESPPVERRAPQANFVT
jgi:hypothetical protein